MGQCAERDYKYQYFNLITLRDFVGRCTMVIYWPSARYSWGNEHATSSRSRSRLGDAPISAITVILYVAKVPNPSRPSVSITKR